MSSWWRCRSFVAIMASKIGKVLYLAHRSPDITVSVLGSATGSAASSSGLSSVDPHVPPQLIEETEVLNG
jgi:hypothetical protein